MRGDTPDRIPRREVVPHVGAGLLTTGPGGEEQKTEYPASSIGIMPVYGYVGWTMVA